MSTIIFFMQFYLLKDVGPQEGEHTGGQIWNPPLCVSSRASFSTHHEPSCWFPRPLSLLLLILATKHLSTQPLQMGGSVHSLPCLSHSSWTQEPDQPAVKCLWNPFIPPASILVLISHWGYFNHTLLAFLLHP